MPTLSGLDIKREIVKTRPKDGECRALVAGFVRSCMTLSITRTDGMLLQLDCQTDFVREYISGLMLNAFKVAPVNHTPSLVYGDCEKLLRLIGVLSADGSVFEITGVPDMPESREWAYVRGIFLGCGSFSAKLDDGTDEQKGGGGYHLEFSVLSESFADELTELLDRRGIASHKMVRADKYVVYVKDSETVCNCLALMKLGKLVLSLNDTMAALSVKKDVNRRMNCDIANMTRTANASVDVLNAIEYIRKKRGLYTLPGKLVEAADARINSPESSLGDIAYELGISKSGLKHRFDRIAEIAKEIEAEDGGV